MMSTFDSYLLCWSSIFINDIVVPMRRKEMTDAHKIWLTRVAIVCCGIFVLLWGYLYKPPQTVLRFMIITGTMYSASVLLTTAMGLYWKRANTVGTFASLVIAGALPLTAIFVKDASVLPQSLQWMASDIPGLGAGAGGERIRGMKQFTVRRSDPREWHSHCARFGERSESELAPGLSRSAAWDRSCGMPLCP